MFILQMNDSIFKLPSDDDDEEEVVAKKKAPAKPKPAPKTDAKKDTKKMTDFFGKKVSVELIVDVLFLFVFSQLLRRRRPVIRDPMAKEMILSTFLSMTRSMMLPSRNHRELYLVLSTCNLFVFRARARAAGKKKYIDSDSDEE